MPKDALVTREAEQLLDDFARAARQRSILILVLVAALAALAWASMNAGPVRIAPGEILRALMTGGDESAIVAREIRLPRTLLSILVGGALGLCGAAAQSLTRNPLADPAIFGAPQAAALGAVCMLYFGYADASSPRLMVAAIGGAALSIAIVLLLVRRRFSIISVLLAGLAIGSLCSAGVAIALSLSPNPFAMAEIVFWLMGSFTDRSLLHVGLSLPFVALGCLIILIAARPTGLCRWERTRLSRWASGRSGPLSTPP